MTERTHTHVLNIYAQAHTFETSTHIPCYIRTAMLAVVLNVHINTHTHTFT